MNILNNFYENFVKTGAKVHYCYFGHEKSLIFKNGSSADIILDMESIKNYKEETECLAHEMGHFETGTYYKMTSKLELKTKHEYAANRWSVENLLPFSDLKNAFLSGITEVWDLSEHFDRTEDFIRLTLKMYEQQGLLPIYEAETE